MHDTSELHKTIVANPRHTVEVKVDIAGVEYGENALIDPPKVRAALFDSPSTLIGNCISTEISFSLMPIAAPPRQAKITLYSRVVLDGQTAEWIKKGEYFFSKRSTDKQTGLLSVTGYDAMLKAESIWLNDDYAAENWPMSAQDAADDIAYRMGVELDPRTSLTGVPAVDYPVDENGDLTMREVLSGIAVSASGNWIITDDGKLYLWRVADIPAEESYLVDQLGDGILIGGYLISV